MQMLNAECTPVTDAVVFSEHCSHVGQSSNSPDATQLCQAYLKTNRLLLNPFFRELKVANLIHLSIFPGQSVGGQYFQILEIAIASTELASLFIGEPGIRSSQCLQAWVRTRYYPVHCK